MGIILPVRNVLCDYTLFPAVPNRSSKIISYEVSHVVFPGCFCIGIYPVQRVIGAIRR